MEEVGEIEDVADNWEDIYDEKGEFIYQKVLEKLADGIQEKLHISDEHELQTHVRTLKCFSGFFQVRLIIHKANYYCY